MRGGVASFVVVCVLCVVGLVVVRDSLQFVLREAEEEGAHWQGAVGLALRRHHDVLGRFPVGARPGRAGAPPARFLVFVGGLQRSGTTTLANGLDAHPWASAQSFDWLKRRVSPEAAEARFAEICAWRGVKRSYLRDVIKSGGVEGKFAQNVYPFAYALRDWGRGGKRALARLRLDADSDVVSYASAEKLWSQWRDFWNASAPVLVEKSPENVVRAPFLQALFPMNARFVFVLRHPLPWALAVDKWLKNKWNSKKTAYLRDESKAMDRRLQMWKRVWTTCVDDLPTLAHAAVVHAEALALDGASPALDRVLGRTPDLSAFRGYARGNLQYVACWLNGAVLDGKKTCVRPSAADRERARPQARRDLERWRKTHGPTLRAFGYATPDFAALLCSEAWCDPPAEADDIAPADVGLDPSSIEDAGLLAAMAGPARA